jgi:hypothetical protein
VLAGEPTNAVSILESVLLEAPQWIDALEVRACSAGLQATNVLQALLGPPSCLPCPAKLADGSQQLAAGTR